MSPRPTSERLWLCYLGCVLLIGGFARGGDALAAALLHGTMVVIVLGVVLLARRRGHDAARLPRAALALVGLPVVFSGLCWLLPGVHPEPFEYRWLAVDRAMLGGDAARLADGWLRPWLVEPLQLCYASFYGIAILSAIGAGVGSGRAAFDRAVLRLVGGFLASYLGYLLFPTLAPKLVLAFDTPPQGLLLTSSLQRWIDGGEMNPWDCFPSGHTMLTLVSLQSLWRWNRRWFRWLLAPGLLLIASTVLLRYHWCVDVVAGALLAWPATWLCDRFADADAWPVATGGPAVTPA